MTREKSQETNGTLSRYTAMKESRNMWSTFGRQFQYVTHYVKK